MKPKFYRKVLKNGMTLLFEKRDLPIVSVAFAARYGGVNESAEERGIAHFIEHMFYKGTKSRTHQQISSEIEKNGGVLNGFTDETITTYWCKMPSDKIDTALAVLGDIVRNSLFEEKEMDKERKVIFEEMKLYHDAPEQYVFEKIHDHLYKNPLGIPLIGTQKTLNSVTREKMVSKFEEIYKTGNLILSVVGDTDFNKLVRFAEKNFDFGKGKIPKQKISRHNKSSVETRKGIDQANLVLAFHTPLSTDKKSYAMNVLMSIMANGLSSRLFHEIREKRNLAYSVYGDVISNRNFSHGFVAAGVLKENVEKVKHLILEEFEKASEDLTEKDLKAAKEQLIGHHRISMESSHSQMIQLLMFEVDGKAKDFYEFEKRTKAVKLKDVKEMAKIKKYSFFALVPEN